MPIAESIHRGDDLFAKKEYQSAAAAYRQALNVERSDGEIYLKLARAYLAAGDSRALAASAEAVRFMPDNIEARLMTSSMLLGREQFVDAATQAEAVLRRDPDNVAALVTFGNAKAHLSYSTLALTKLDETMRTSGDYYYVQNQLRTRVASWDDRAAEAALRKAVDLQPTRDNLLALVNFYWAAGRPDEGEEYLRHAADLDQEDWFIHRLLGGYYSRKNRDAEAEQYLKVAVFRGDNYSRLQLLDFYLKAGRDLDALSTVEPLRENPSDAVAVRIAALELRQGLADSALQRVEAVLTREPINTRAMIVKAQALLLMGKTPEALAASRAAVAAAPTSSEANATLGRVLLASGDSESAFHQFAAAIRLDPGSAELPVQLARTALATGRDRVALDYARQAAREHPDDPTAPIMVVQALIRLRDLAGAEYALQQLLKQRPTAPDVQVQLGNLRAAAGDEKAARRAFEAALKTSPDSIEAVSGLISLDLNRPDVATARKRLDPALARHPSDVGLLQLASRVFRAEGNSQREETTLRRALDVEPGNVGAALMLVDCLSVQNRREEAMRLLEGVLSRQPSSIPAQTALGVLLERMGRLNEARARYEKIIADDKGAGTAASRLALLYVDRNDNLDVALAFMTEAKRSAPNDPEVSDALGWVYLQKNLMPLALPHLEDAVKGNPRNAVFHYHLGTAYVRAGQPERARRALTQALALDNNFPERSKAQTALAALPQ